jgi:hypothetical protein
VGWLADFGEAALRVHHDPPGFPAVQFLVASQMTRVRRNASGGPASTSTRKNHVTV